MKKLFLSLMVLLSFNNVMHAVPVRLPDAATLTKRLHCFEHFAEKTNVIQELAGREGEVTGIAVAIFVAVELALSDYSQYMKDPNSTKQMYEAKTFIFLAILEGFPEIIEKLIELQFI
jgi:hypothetical protein